METTAVTTGTSAADASRTQIAGKFNDFLKLLTTQLQYQDPLSPLDSTQFVEQLVSFTQVEQSINTNANLESLISLVKGGQDAAVVGYLGKTVEAEGDTALLRNGTAGFTYDLPKQAATATVAIKDEAGNIVFSSAAETSVGRHAFAWNGLNTVGVSQPEGLYTIVVTAKDEAGASIPVATTYFGRVEAIDQSGAEIFLQVDGTTLPLSSVLAVFAPAQPGANES